MGSVLSVLAALPTIFKAIREIISVGWSIVRLFDKDPVAEQAKKEAEHADGQNKAETSDDTSGLLK